MSNSARMRLAISDFVAQVRQHPADAVGAPLADLEQVARDSRGFSDSVAMAARVANTTWMTRVQMTRAALESPPDTILIPYPCTIVGCIPVLQNIDTTNPARVEAPLAAFDIGLQINRKDILTSTTDRVISQTQDVSIVSLAAFDPVLSLRTFELDLEADKNTISVKIRWSLPIATVTTLDYADTQISINWFVDRATK